MKRSIFLTVLFSFSLISSNCIQTNITNKLINTGLIVGGTGSFFILSLQEISCRLNIIPPLGCEHTIGAPYYKLRYFENLENDPEKENKLKLLKEIENAKKWFKIKRKAYILSGLVSSLFGLHRIYSQKN